MQRDPGFEAYRQFPSQRPNQCRRCGRSIPVGEVVLGMPRGNGQWDIVGLECATVGGHGTVHPHASPVQRGLATKRRYRPAAPAKRRRPPPHRRGRPPGIDWPSLVRYLMLCVRRESEAVPVPLKEHGRWAVLDVDVETLLCGNGTSLPLTKPLQALFAGLEDKESVLCGWPTLVVEDERGVLSVAPLLVRSLDKPSLCGEQGEHVVAASDAPPRVNGGLLTEEWFPDECVHAARTLAEEGPNRFGDTLAIRAYAGALLDALGVTPGGGLDPGRLLPVGQDSTWRPQQAGIYNVAMAFANEANDATRMLLLDLESMLEATDWHQTAAKYLFETAPSFSPRPAKFCPTTLNDSQELALAATATKPLTVITGPPGTGKSQTVAAIVADAWLRDETVLVTSTNNRPIDGVVADKLRPLDEGLILRTGNKANRHALSAQLVDLVPAICNRPQELRAPNVHRLSRKRTARMQRLATLARLERAVRVAAGSNENGTADSQALQKALRKLKRFERRYSRTQLLAAFNAVTHQWRIASQATVRSRVRQRFSEGAPALADLPNELLADDKRRQEAIARAMLYVKGWATSAYSARANVACQAGIFDLVVIDEASQCNLAVSLPLAYRAKRLVIVGDPNQLPPVVKLTSATLRAVAAEAGVSHEDLRTAQLTYGEDSAFSTFLARHGREPYLLSEHFRCHPEIIQFCNQHFYDNQLTVLTRVRGDPQAPSGLQWREVAGRTTKARSGAVNREEAQAIVAYLRQQQPQGKVGIVTPFRQQVRLINLLLRQSAVPASEVTVGTAHAFQGDECDTILFSTVLSKGASVGTASWIEKERNLINVAVSRARNHLVAFGNRCELERLGVRTLVALADLACDHGTAHVCAVPVEAQRVCTALLALGMTPRLAQAHEGFPLTIAVEGANGQRANIEILDFPQGDPLGAGQRQAAARDEILEGLGWSVLRVPAWRAFMEADEVAQEVGARLS